VKLLAIDPGDKNHGFALFEQQNKDLWNKIRIGVRTESDELYQLIKTQEPNIVIVEKFMTYPWKSKQQSWSKQKTPQIIGGIKALATVYGFEVIEQSTSNRDIGYMWGSIKKLPKSNPSNHAHDAEAHAVFYIIDNGGVING
jgi:hypothetical protein